MSDQEIKRWQQQDNSVLPYSFDFDAFVDAHSLTLAGVTGTSSNTAAITLADEVVSGASVWSANLTAVAAGSSMITLTASFTGDNASRIRKFIVDVVEPTT